MKILNFKSTPKSPPAAKMRSAFPEINLLGTVLSRTPLLGTLLLGTLLFGACSAAQTANGSQTTASQATPSQATPSQATSSKAKASQETGFMTVAQTETDNRNALSAIPHRPVLDTAIFAGGCFWCVESDFEKLPGVLSVVSGYTGGGTPNPSYKNHGQHLEAAKIFFDATKITYRELLDYYWKHVDPTDPNGQFCDKGHSYKTAIFARPEQMEAAEKSKAKIIKIKPFEAPIVTPVLSVETFWKAEEYHQDYYKKNPVRYKFYRKGCGRDAKLESLWGQK